MSGGISMVIADIEWIDIKKALPKLNDGGRAVTVYMLLKKNVGTPNVLRGMFFMNGKEPVFSSGTDIDINTIQAWAYRE